MPRAPLGDRSACVPQVRILATSAHVRCVLADAAGARLDAIAFRAAGEPLGRALMATNALPLHVAGTLKADTWQGRTRVQLIIDDAAPAEGHAGAATP